MFGTISTETGVLRSAPYGFKSRFEDGKGTNPEELIAAAHAGCFSMALSMMLGEAGSSPERIQTEAAVNIEKKGDVLEITSSHLTVSARVPGMDEAKFLEVANKAKEGCPVSKLLNAEITMDATLKVNGPHFQISGLGAVAKASGGASRVYSPVTTMWKSQCAWISIFVKALT